MDNCNGMYNCMNNCNGMQNCMNNCNNMHNCNDMHNCETSIPKVDYSNVTVVRVPEWDTAVNFIDTPVWDERCQCIYAQDFAATTNFIYRFDYKTRQVFTATLAGETRPTTVMPIQGCDKQFLIGFESNYKLCEWDGVSPTVTEIRSVFTTNGHIDKAVTDLGGHLHFGNSNISVFCGSPPDFAFYRFDKGKVTKTIDHIKSTTAVAIDHKRHKLYHADLCYYQIVQFDLDPKTGDICEYFISITF